jgi:hypothetical protein
MRRNFARLAWNALLRDTTRERWDYLGGRMRRFRARETKRSQAQSVLLRVAHCAMLPAFLPLVLLIWFGYGGWLALRYRDRTLRFSGEHG